MAVVVVIQKGHAAAHGFRQQFVAVSTVVVDEINSRFLRDVSEFCDGNFLRDGISDSDGQQKRKLQCALENIFMRGWMKCLLKILKLNPKGIPAHSPGLRRRSYLGKTTNILTTPTGLQRIRGDVMQPRWG